MFSGACFITTFECKGEEISKVFNTAVKCAEYCHSIGKKCSVLQPTPDKDELAALLGPPPRLYNNGP